MEKIKLSAELHNKNIFPKACVFCGQRGGYILKEKNYDDCQYKCENCLACGPIAENPEEAVKVWNMGLKVVEPKK